MKLEKRKVNELTRQLENFKKKRLSEDLEIEDKAIIEIPIVMGSQLKDIEKNKEIASKVDTDRQKAVDEFKKVEQKNIDEAKKQIKSFLGTLDEHYKDLYLKEGNDYTVHCKGRRELRNLIEQCKLNNIRYKWDKLIEGDYRYDVKFSLNEDFFDEREVELNSEPTDEIVPTPQPEPQQVDLNNLKIGDVITVTQDLLNSLMNVVDSATKMKDTLDPTPIQEPITEPIQEPVEVEQDTEIKVEEGLKLNEDGEKGEYTLANFSDDLFDTILKNDRNPQLDLDKFDDDLDFPNEVDRKNGIIRLSYNGKRYELTIREVNEIEEGLKLNEDAMYDDNLAFLKEYGVSETKLNDCANYLWTWLKPYEVVDFAYAQAKKDRKCDKQKAELLLDKFYSLLKTKVNQVLEEGKQVRQQFIDNYYNEHSKQEKLQPKKLGQKTIKEELKVVGNLEDYAPSDKAKPLYDEIVSNGMLEDLDKLFGEIYQDGASINELNNLLANEKDFVRSMLGLDEVSLDDDKDQEMEQSIMQDIIDDDVKPASEKEPEPKSRGSVDDYFSDETGYGDEDDDDEENLSSLKAIVDSKEAEEM